MSKKEVKTNAMRMLDRQKIPYEYEEYESRWQINWDMIIRLYIRPW